VAGREGHRYVFRQPSHLLNAQGVAALLGVLTGVACRPFNKGHLPSVQVLTHRYVPSAAPPSWHLSFASTNQLLWSDRDRTPRVRERISRGWVLNDDIIVGIISIPLPSRGARSTAGMYGIRLFGPTPHPASILGRFACASSGTVCAYLDASRGHGVPNS
jgi:hypothetical protein